MSQFSSASNIAPGGLNYLGTWDANTNTPTIVSGTGTQGDYYLVSVAGTTDIDGFSDWQVGDWIIFNGTTWQEIDNQNSNYVYINHGDLRDLADEGLLRVGTFYIIQDYQTIYARPDYDGSGTIKSTLTIVTAPVEPLIVQAIAPGKLSSTAKSTYFPLDQIQYDINVITTYDYGGATNSAPCKGRITERITPEGLRADYDHRVVEFIRYERLPGTSEFYDINDNGGATQLFNTFDPGKCYDVSLPDTYTARDVNGFEFPNTVFQKATSGSKFYGYTYNNTFNRKTSNNTVGVCQGNITGLVNCNINYLQENVGLIFDGVQAGVCQNNVGTYAGNNISLVTCPIINGNILANPGAGISRGTSGTIENTTVEGSISRFSFITFDNNVVGDSLENVSGTLEGRTVNATLYPDLFTGVPTQNWSFMGDPNGDQYYRYFDGSIDVTNIIV